MVAKENVNFVRLDTYKFRPAWTYLDNVANPCNFFYLPLPQRSFVLRVVVWALCSYGSVVACHRHTFWNTFSSDPSRTMPHELQKQRMFFFPVTYIRRQTYCEVIDEQQIPGNCFATLSMFSGGTTWVWAPVRETIWGPTKWWHI